MNEQTKTESPKKPLTKAEIIAIKDRGERKQAIRENMHLFSKEIGKER